MKSKLKIYCLSCILPSLVLTALRYLTLSSSYNAEIGYFDQSLLLSITNVLYIAVAAWCVSAFIFIPKSQITTDFTPNFIWQKGASVFSAIMFLFSAILILRSASSALGMIGALTAAISTLFFILSLVRNELSDKIRAFTSVSLTASLAIVLAILYFDMTIAMNSPHKLYGGFTLMSSMVFSLCETRTYLGKPLPRLHLVTGLLTSTLGISFSLSSIIYVLFEHPSNFVSNPIVLGNIGHIGIIIGISVYAITRCFAFHSKVKSTNIQG